jgi:glycosyltransferase involved in cell wall biosynthesis
MYPDRGPLDLDVIIPFYFNDSIHLLSRAITSVFAQDHPPGSLFVVINGGGVIDRSRVSVELDALFSSTSSTRFIICNSCVPGIAHALNVGLTHSRASMVARLDADDWMDGSRLRVFIDFCERCLNDRGRVPDVIGSFVIVHEVGEVCSSWVMKKPCSNAQIRRSLLWSNPFAHPSVMFRRSLVLGIGGYRDIRASEDLDLWLRLSANPDVRFANIPIALTHYSLVQGSLSHSRDSFLWAAICRLRHARNPLLFLLMLPKIVFDLFRYLLGLLR